MDKVRLGMIGSQLAADLHLNNLLKLRGLEVDVVVFTSQRTESAEAFAKEFNIPHYYNDCRRLLEGPDIDVVDLCVTKAGWDFPNPDDDRMRGFPQEVEDFTDAILFDREPAFEIDLAGDVVETIYAGLCCVGKRDVHDASLRR